MRKIRWLAFGGLALVLSSFGGLQHASPTEAVNPGVTVTVTQSGNLATFVIIVRNNNPGPIGTDVGQRGQIRNAEIKGLVPEGTELVQCWAGAGPGQGLCQFTPGDRAASWLHLSAINPGASRGPFVFTIDTKGQRVCSFGHARFTGGSPEASGATTSDVVCTQ